MAEVEIESVKVKGTLISELIKEGALKDIKNISEDINIVAVIMIKKKDKNLLPTTIILNHQSAQEIQEKIMHIDCNDSAILEKVTKLINKNEK